jgi:signal peptidase II
METCAAAARRSWVINPPRHGEGDHRASDGGGGSRQATPVSHAPSTTPSARSPSPFRGGYIVALAVFLIDQLSKWFVTGPLRLPERDVLDMLPIFRLQWVQNRGISMGFLVAGSDMQRWLLALATGAIAVFVALWLSRERRRLDSIALGLVLGGAIGNILDRVRLGYVTDFLNLHFGAWSPFLVFNVADAAISIGVALLVLRAFLTRDTPAPSGGIE